MSLIKSMYGSEFYPVDPRDSRFGLNTGQMRSLSMTHNSGWYNKAGEKLGWGDLSPQDFERIKAELEDGELFIILGERDSFWNFVTEIGKTGATSTVTPDVEAPGVDYVVEKASYVITRDGIYYLDMASETTIHCGLEIKALKRKDLKKLVK